MTQGKGYGMRSFSISILVIALAAACGDDDDGGAADAAAGADAPMATADAGLEPDAVPPVATTCTCLALGVDYGNMVGTVARLELPSLAVTQDVLPGAASSDPVVRYQDGRLYVVNRFGFDNVTVIDAATFTVLDQFSTGAGSNPQDIAVKGTKAYVAALGRPEVLVFDLDDTSAAPVTIALPTVAADVDGNPDAASIAIRGNQAFVTLEHLENFAPVATGEVVVIDLASDTVATTFQLSGANPAGFLRERPTAGDLLVAVVPDYSGTTGCVERVKGGGTPGSDGCLATHEDLGGYVNAIAPGDDGSVYVAVQPSWTEGKIVRVADDGTIDPDAVTAADQLVTDAAYCGATHQLVVTDANDGGLRVYDLTTGAEVTTTALSIGLSPGFASSIACYSL